MAIDQKVKDAVRAKLLADLDEYFQEAEEHEDDVPPAESSSAAGRLDDFYLYQSAKRS